MLRLTSKHEKYFLQKDPCRQLPLNCDKIKFCIKMKKYFLNLTLKKLINENQAYWK